MVEEVTGRRFLVVLALLTIIGLYAYALSQYYAGAHGGVDQNGYMMTARLLAGQKNEYAPAHPEDVPSEVLKSYDAARESKAARAAAEVKIAAEKAAEKQAQAQARNASTNPSTAPAAALPARAETAAPHTPTSMPALVTPTVAYATDELQRPNELQRLSWFDFIRNRLSFVPESPFQYAGRMCIFTEPYGPVDAAKPPEYRVYAKYPFGFPLLAALGRLVIGFDGYYIINPLCTVLACYFAYFLFRQVVSPFMSLMGVIWLACNPLTLIYANDANSHASTLLCVCVGFWGLLSWMRLGTRWRGFIGGLALGYSCTIRYSEFLLVLPVLFASLQYFRFNRQRALGSLCVLVGWAIPIAVLAGACWICFGAPWKTGYTYCREDTGFGWKYLTGDVVGPMMGRQANVGNWETLVQQMNRTGLFMMWPIALAGLFAMVGSAWRLGVTIALWVLPCTFLYMLYYWAPGGETTVGYMRFFLSIMPGLILAGLWVLEKGLSHVHGEKWPSLVIITIFGLALILIAAMYVSGEGPIIGLKVFPQMAAALWEFVATKPGGIATGIVLALLAGIWLFDRSLAASKVGLALGAAGITALGCAVNVYNITPQLERTHAQWVGLRETVDVMRGMLPRGAVLFADDQTSNQLDAVGQWQLYDASLFQPQAFAMSKRKVDMRDRDKDLQDDPDPIQFERSLFYMKLLGRQNASGTWYARQATEMQQYQYNVIDKALADGHRVAFLVMEREDRGGRPGSRVVVPQRPGFEVKKLGQWVTLQQVTGTVALLPRWQAWQGRGAAAAAALPAAGRGGGYYVLYEMVAKPKPAIVEAVSRKPEASGASASTQSSAGGAATQPSATQPARPETALERIRRRRAEQNAASTLPKTPDAPAPKVPEAPKTPDTPKPPAAPAPEPPFERKPNIFGN